MDSTRIDPTPVRISTNTDVARQTPKTDFGDRVKAGLDTTAGAVANGAAVVAPFLPGGAIVSAAVSSAGSMTNAQSSGQAPGQSSVTAQYASTGVTNLGGTTIGGGGINTTVGSIGGTTVGGTVGGTVGIGSVGGTTTGSTGSYSGVGQLQTGGGSGELGAFNQEMMSAQADNTAMIQVQIQMQHESQVFSTISNVLKVRADTVKNTIQNVH
jgi:hypothetical protein